MNQNQISDENTELEFQPTQESKEAEKSDGMICCHTINFKTLPQNNNNPNMDSKVCNHEDVEMKLEFGIGSIFPINSATTPNSDNFSEKEFNALIKNFIEEDDLKTRAQIMNKLATLTSEDEKRVNSLWNTELPKIILKNILKWHENFLKTQNCDAALLIIKSLFILKNCLSSQKNNLDDNSFKNLIFIIGQILSIHPKYLEEYKPVTTPKCEIWICESEMPDPKKTIGPIMNIRIITWNFYEALVDIITNALWIASDSAEWVINLQDIELSCSILNKSQIVKYAIKYLGVKDRSIKQPALRAIAAYLASEHSVHTDIVLNNCFLNYAMLNLNSQIIDQRKEMAWALSNVTAGNSDQIIRILKYDQGSLIKKIIQMSKTDVAVVKQEAEWVIRNIPLNNATIYKIYFENTCGFP